MAIEECFGAKTNDWLTLAFYAKAFINANHN
jgi:hypothetical protein